MRDLNPQRYVPNVVCYHYTNSLINGDAEIRTLFRRIPFQASTYVKTNHPHLMRIVCTSDGIRTHTVEILSFLTPATWSTLVIYDFSYIYNLY